jgi:anoctamin-10
MLVSKIGLFCRGNADIPDQSQAIAQLEKLLQTLAQVGLQAEVRQGDELSLLVFVRASEKRLKHAVYRSRWVF